MTADPRQQPPPTQATAPEGPVGPESWPSLDVVRAEFNIEAASQDKRGDTLDSRAGTVLGFSGVLAGLALNSKSPWALPGALVAAVAALLAAGVVWPRMYGTIGPRALTLEYLDKPAEATKRKVLDTRIDVYEKNQAQLKIKTKRLRWAIRLLTAAVLLVVGALGILLLAKII